MFLAELPGYGGQTLGTKWRCGVRAMREESRGISLVELLLAVTLLSVLAVVGLTAFQLMQLRAMRSEAPTNLEQIREAELAYQAEWGSFTSAGPTPATTPGRGRVDFEPRQAWVLLGWLPQPGHHSDSSLFQDARVRGKYQVTRIAGTSPETDDFQARAVIDADGDATEASYSCNRADPPVMESAADVY